jgi:hypothetical protein
MKKHMKFMVIVIASIVILAVGLTTTVLAWGSSNSENGESPGPRQSFISKTANILGLDEEVLADAMKQAGVEMRKEANQRYLQKAVEDGVITAEEADLILEWVQNRPDVLERLRQPRHSRLGIRCLTTKQRLDIAVDNETITEERTAQILESRQDSPAIVNEELTLEQRFRNAIRNGRITVEEATQIFKLRQGSPTIGNEELTLEQRLRNAVRNGRITVEEAAQILKSRQDSPAIVNEELTFE